MIQNLSKAYITLLMIFGVVLIVGSVKSTIYPDETVYVPGKIIALYDSTTESFIKETRKKPFVYVNSDKLQANIIGKTSYNSCQ